MFIPHSIMIKIIIIIIKIITTLFIVDNIVGISQFSIWTT